MGWGGGLGLGLGGMCVGGWSGKRRRGAGGAGAGRKLVQVVVRSAAEALQATGSVAASAGQGKYAASCSAYLSSPCT